MNSVSVTSSAESGTGKLQARKPASPSIYASEPCSDKGTDTEAQTTTTVVVIKAEPCEESPTGILNGVPSKNIMNVEVSGTENGGSVDSMESGASKAAINGTNQNRMIRAASAKSKHLTRSHAMRESASPPRTPVVRECNGQVGAQSCDGQDVTDSQAVNSTSLTEVVTPPKIYPADSAKGTSQLDLDFPKLNAPKPKSPRNMDKSQSSDSSKSVNSLDAHSPTTTLNRKNEGLGRNISPCSQHSNKELSALDNDSPLLSPGSYDNRSSGRDHSKSPSGENRNSNYHGNSGGKKHKGASGAKNAKPRLKAQGSSSSMEGNNNSTVFISKDNSFEQFTDQSGVDLIKFFRETLNKNAKDRSMLLKIEKELHDLATDRSRLQVKFPSMSSYNRMLIHRCAAYFGMDHNVDTSQTSVIVAVTKSTRIPEILFDTLIRESLDEPRKSILKRDSHSFDECRQSLLPNPDRGFLDRKAKSFEEREEEYEKARRRIFKGRELVGYHRGMEMQDENSWPWSSTESSDNSTKMKAQNNRLLKVHSLSVDTRHDRPSVSKSHSFGGYGGPNGGSHHNNHMNRGDSITSTKSAGPRFFTKQDSMGGTPWRLSPSSSGYKTQTQSIRSDSITPSPTGYGSGGEHTPEPQSLAQSPAAAGNRSVVWAVTDMASVPRGSVLIDPQTLQPIVNQDGSIYYFDPSNVSPIAMKMTHHGHMNRHYPPPFMTGGGGGHASARRRSDRAKGPAEENVVAKEKGSSNTASIDVIPEDQFQGNFTPPEVISGSSAPEQEGSQYTKGETSSPEDLEDNSVKEVSEEKEVPEDNVERIFVPEHKNQATSPCHPLAQPEEYAVANTSDGELASSSKCLTPPQEQRSIQETPTAIINPQPESEQREDLSKDVIKPIATSLSLPQNEPETPETTTTIESMDAVADATTAVGNVDSSVALSLNATTNATSTDSHNLTISTTCTSSSSTHSTAANTLSLSDNTGKSGAKGDAQSVAGKPVQHKSLNPNNSQGDQRSNATTIASPSYTSTSYHVHSGGQPQQYVAHHQGHRQEDPMNVYQQSAITYATTAMDANGNTYAGTANMPYAATYQQMPDSGGYMVYAAPYPMEAVSEMPYYVPVYDQAGNATLVPASSGREHQQATILQAAPPPGTHVYQAAPNTALIPALPPGSQLVYAPDGQFGAASMQQPQQFGPASYPPGTAVTYAPYGAAYNAPSTYHANFWGQPLTYYVSSPPAQTAPPAAVPIPIPVPLPQPMNTQPQNVKNTGTPSNPPTPQATTFGGNPFSGGPTGPMQMQMSGSVSGESMPPPVYAISAGMPMQMGGPQGQNKFQNMYPYSTPMVQMPPPSAASATPPTAIYQQAPHHPPVVVHSSGKPATTNSPPQATVASTDLSTVTNSSSAVSTPLQKSPPNHFPDTGSSYEKKNRRGPSMDMGATYTPNTGPPRSGYMGHGYPRNPNQAYNPRGYAPKKHHSSSSMDGAPNAAMNHNKTIVLNAPMQQSSGSPAIYSHYHPSSSGTHNPSQAPTPHHQPGIRGPRPKPANLDLRRAGSHYQPPNIGGVGNGNSQRNTPSTNSTESNNSPNSVTGGMGDHGRNSGHMGYYPAPNAGGVPHPGGHLVMHQPLMGSPATAGGHPGMYVKLGQTYFPHPTLAAPMGGNRRSPPNEIRPQFNHSLTTGLYPMNMQISGPRHSGPRHSHHNSYKGSR